MKLAPAARRALVAVARGAPLKRTLVTFCAFGELARFGLIEVTRDAAKWRLSERGREVLVTLPRYP